MTNTERITANNASLRECINAAENLPDAGGGDDTRFRDYIEGTLTEIIDDTITVIKPYAFRSEVDLTKVSFPSAVSVGTNAFRECSALHTVDLPNFNKAIPTYCFDSCDALKNLSIPNTTGVNNYSFRYCAELEKVELGNATSIGTQSFGSCSKLVALIIRREKGKTCSLTNKNAFTGTPIESGTGYVYFYRDNVNAQKALTNWATYAEQIRAIEDYPEICGGGA